MDCYSVGEKRDLQEMPHILLHPQRDLLGSSTYAAAAAAAAVPEKVGKDQMDLLAVAPLLPFGRLAEEGCCLKKQMDLALQMDLEPGLHIRVAVQIYMLLHHTSC